jgi:hypothetical protein
MSAAEYFLQLERLAAIAGIDIEDDRQVMLKIEKGLNSGLVDRLYQGDRLPDGYQQYR